MVGLVDLDRWTNLSPEPKLYLFSGFCRAHYCDRPTDSPTDHTTRSVTIGRVYVVMRPNNYEVIINKGPSIRVLCPQTQAISTGFTGVQNDSRVHGPCSRAVFTDIVWV